MTQQYWPPIISSADRRLGQRVVQVLLGLTLLLPTLLTGCGGTDQPAPTASPTAPAPTATAPVPGPRRPDYWPTTGWRTSTPEEQGVDSQQLLRALERIDSTGINVRSLTVIRNGYIVLEAYYQPFTAGQLYYLASVTKSVIGNLMGIALAEGKFKDVKQPVLSFFPNRPIANRDSNKEAITLEDLLSMQPGLDCADETLNGAMEASADWVQFALDRPMAGPPGQKLVYCTAGPHILSAVLTRATGMSTQAYAQARLFTPLGIAADSYGWGADPQGITLGGYGLLLTPRDMAKLGLLYLNNGRWADQQVIPADWMATAQRAHAFGADNKNYGYLFWVYPSHYAAEGMGEQKIMVVPDRNMIVVFTAAIDWHKGSVLEPLLDDYLLPAAKANGPLPANPGALAALQAKVKSLTNPVQPVPRLPAIAQQISGKPYLFPDNALGLTAITLTFKEGSAEAQAIVRSTGGVQEVAIGLDNVYRITQDENGATTALRGRWLDDHTFAVRALQPPNIQEVEYRLDFSGGQLKAHIEEVILGTFSANINSEGP